MALSPNSVVYMNHVKHFKPPVVIERHDLLTMLYGVAEDVTTSYLEGNLKGTNMKPASNGEVGLYNIEQIEWLPSYVLESPELYRAINEALITFSDLMESPYINSTYAVGYEPKRMYTHEVINAFKRFLIMSYRFIEKEKNKRK